MNIGTNTIYLRQKKTMRKEINLPKKAIEQLEKRAKSEGRSLKNYIEFILLSHIQFDPAQIRDKKIHD